MYGIYCQNRAARAPTDTPRVEDERLCCRAVWKAGNAKRNKPSPD
jgi:hypothetical protein